MSKRPKKPQTKPLICAGRTRAGAPCGRPAKSGSTWCAHHDPAFRAAAQVAGRKKGARVRAERRGKNLSEAIAETRAAFPNLGLEDLATVAFYEYQRAQGGLLRARFLALAIQACGKLLDAKTLTAGEAITFVKEVILAPRPSAS